MACERALFRSRTCYRCAFICSFSKFSGHRKSHASSNKATLHAWLFLAHNLSSISLSHFTTALYLHSPATRCPGSPHNSRFLPVWLNVWCETALHTHHVFPTCLLQRSTLTFIWYIFGDHRVRTRWTPSV